MKDKIQVNKKLEELTESLSIAAKAQDRKEVAKLEAQISILHWVVGGVEDPEEVLP